MGRQLPNPPLISVDLDKVSSSIDQRSATGSNLQRGFRKGSHYMGTFVLHPLDHAAAREWLDLRTEADTVVLPLDQPGLVKPPYPATNVNGSGQSGASLNIKGFNPGDVIQKGQVINHIGSDGLSRIYIADAEATANGSGIMVLPLETMLNWPPLNNDIVEINDVVIEGFATVEPGSWLQDGSGYHNIRFTVEEPG